MMNVARASRREISSMVVSDAVFDNFMRATPIPWICRVDEELACVWGLVPPTLMSDTAYLWVRTYPPLKGNEFLFIRHSQRWLEAALEEFPNIIGHTTPDMPQAIRWIKLCGGVFGELEEGGLLPFTIRKRQRG